MYRFYKYNRDVRTDTGFVYFKFSISGNSSDSVDYIDTRFELISQSKLFFCKKLSPFIDVRDEHAIADR